MCECELLCVFVFLWGPAISLKNVTLSLLNLLTFPPKQHLIKNVHSKCVLQWYSKDLLQILDYYLTLAKSTFAYTIYTCLLILFQIYFSSTWLSNTQPPSQPSTKKNKKQKQNNATSKKTNRPNIKTTKATLFHESLNIFICDIDNILVIQDIKQPFAMDTAKQHLHTKV